MKATSPLISIIMPVYNCGRFLENSISSITDQSYTPVEVIVIDSSDDHSADFVKKYEQVRYLFQEKCGLPSALNKGLEIATGDFLGFLDADDAWTSDKLSLQMDALKADPSLDAVFGHHRRFLSEELAGIPGQIRIDEQKVLPAPFKGAMLIRRESFFRVGLFDTHLQLGDFIDWYKRAMEAGLKFLTLPEVVLLRRIHDDNTSVRNRAAEKDYVRIMKAALDRKREKDSGK
jgi:glycosyltransferase involved in cell wall biosynthesis